MGIADTRQRTLIRACNILGDEMALAHHLGIPVSQVVDWILGDVEVPTEHFLLVVDVVLASNRKIVELNREFLRQVRERHQR